MNSNRKTNAIRNMIFGLINKILTLIAPFVILALINKKLGAEYLGLNNLFTSIIQILSLTEIGIGSALVYEMYKPVAENNKKELSAILNFYKRIYRVLSVIIFAIGLIILPFTKKLITGDIPDSINVYYLFIIYLSNTFLSYSLFSYKRSILNAYQRLDIVSKINFAVNIMMYFAQLLILICFRNYYLYVMMIPIFTIVDNLFVNYYTKKNYADISPNGEVSPQVKIEIGKKVKALAGHKIGAVVISSLDSVVISIFLGLKELALYSNYFFIVKAMNGIINIIFNSILPGIGNSLIVENKKHNYILYKKMNFALSCFVGMCSICFLVGANSFIKLWMGEKYLLPLHTLVLFVLYFYVWQIRIISLAFKDAAGMWKEDFYKPYIGLFVNLVTNVILVKIMGLDGVLISTIIVMAFIYFPWEIKILHEKLFNEKYIIFIIKQVVHFIITIVACIVSYKITSDFQFNNLVNFIISVCIGLIIISLLYYLFYRNNDDFKLVKNDLTNLMKKVIKMNKNKKSILEKNNNENNEEVVLYVNKSECCGCFACKAICPIKAIEIQSDGQGFSYPCVNREKCKSCKSCIKVCPLKSGGLDEKKTR